MADEGKLSPDQVTQSRSTDAVQGVHPGSSTVTGAAQRNLAWHMSGIIVILFSPLTPYSHIIAMSKRCAGFEISGNNGATAGFAASGFKVHSHSIIRFIMAL